MRIVHIAPTPFGTGGLHVHALRVLTFLRGHPAHPVTLSLPTLLRHADLVHTHHMRSVPSRLAALTVYARRRPAVVTDHGTPHKGVDRLIAALWCHGRSGGAGQQKAFLIPIRP